MYNLSETGRLSLVSLFRQITQNNPPIQLLNMNDFSSDRDSNMNMGEFVLEALLGSNIQSITDLNLYGNSSWFKNPETQEEKSGSVDLLVELIS